MRSRLNVNPLDYSRKLWMRLAMGFTFFFLYFPILSLIVFSFNDSKRNITWRGFTLKYYEKAFDNTQLHEAFANSLIVAGISTVTATILGAMLGLALYKFRFPAQGPYEGMVHLPIVIPEICLAVAMVAFFATVDVPLGLITITVSHIAFSIPFVAVVIRAKRNRKCNMADGDCDQAQRDIYGSRSGWHARQARLCYIHGQPNSAQG